MSISSTLPQSNNNNNNINQQADVDQWNEDNSQEEMKKPTDLPSTTPLEDNPTFVPNDMKNLSHYLDELSLKIQNYSVRNLSDILREIEVQKNMNQLNRSFRIFSREAKKYFVTSEYILEKEHTNSLAPMAALKQIASEFSALWEKFCTIMSVVRSQGIESLHHYIKQKSQDIDQILFTLSNCKDPRTIHLEEMKRTTKSLRQSLTHIEDSITILIQTTDLTNFDETIFQEKVSAIRKFLRDYNEANFKTFHKSGFNNQELSKWKTATLTSSNDIVAALRCVSTFYHDMDTFSRLIDSIQNILVHIMVGLASQSSNKTQNQKNTSTLKLIKVPNSKASQAPKFKVQLKTSPRSNSSITSKSPIQDLESIEPISTAEKQAQALLGQQQSSRVELFIETITKKLGITLEPNELDPDEEFDTWKKLDLLQVEIVSKIEHAQNIENDLQELQKRTKIQSGQINSLIENDKIAREENAARVTQMKQQIKEYEDQVSDLMKQRTVALESVKQREHQLFKLRGQFSESEHRRTLETVATTLSKFLNNDQYKVYDVLQHENINQRVEKLLDTLIKIRCPKCRAHDEQTMRVMKRINDAMHLHKGDTIETAIETLVKKFLFYSKKVAESNITLGTNKEDLDNYEAGIKTIIEIIGKESNEPLTNPQELCGFAINSLKQLIQEYEDKLVQKDIDNNKENAKTLSFILQSLYSISPSSMSTQTTETDILKLIMNKMKETESNFRELEKKIDEDEEVINNTIVWFIEEIKNNSLSFDISSNNLQIRENRLTNFKTIMNLISTKPNPLSPVIQVFNKEKADTQALMIVIYAKICGLLKKKGENITKLNLFNIVKKSNEMLDEAQDFLDHAVHTSELAQNELHKFRDKLYTLYLKLIHFVHPDNNLQNSSNNYSTEVIVEKLIDFVDDFIRLNDNTIPTLELNELTQKTREMIELSNMREPKMYIPLLMDKLAMSLHSINFISSFEVPLVSILQFDISKSFSDVNQIHLIKQKIDSLHSILEKELSGNIEKSVVRTLTRFVSLVSVLFESNQKNS